MSHRNHKYDVHVNWPTVVPLGDTLAVSTDNGFDDRWTKAFDVVADEHQRRTGAQEWGGIECASDDQKALVLYVRKIKPGAQSAQLRRTVDDIVKAANTVAQIGTHVYELARELREGQATTAKAATAQTTTAQATTAQGTTPQSSTPPPLAERPAEELRADAA